MKDMPVFTTEHGVASLILREIPYRKRACIRLQASCEPEKLVRECADFCRACGAEVVLATGNDALKGWPLYAAVMQMRRPLAGMEKANARLFPVTEETEPRWRAIYNEKMETVDNAAYMDSRDGQEMLQKGDGYFLHRDGQLLGIGRASDGCIHAVAAVQPGAGETAVRALCELLNGDTVSLQVASTNHKAIALYERLGFVKTAEISRWYRIV